MAKFLQALGKFKQLSPSSTQLSIFNNRNLNLFNKKEQVEDPYILLKPTEEDVPEILDLMWNSFHLDEPTTAALSLGFNRNPVFDNTAMQKLAQGYSYIARCKYDGCLVGGCLNSVACPWDPDITEKFACTIDCPKIVQLYMFWAYLQRAPRLWEQYCADKILELSMLFVRKYDRQRGLAERLLTQSRILAADAGFNVIRCDATSVYTAAICEKMKMKLVYEIPYGAYVGPDGHPIFNIPAPHTSVKVYVETPHAV